MFHSFALALICFAIAHGHEPDEYGLKRQALSDFKRRSLNGGDSKPCTLAGCEICTKDGKECAKCKENHMAMAADSCTSFDELFSGVSDSDFTLSGNLVLMSSKKIADWLAGSFAGAQGKYRYDAARYAIAAFSRQFKDQFDAVAVFPSRYVKSGSTHSQHWHWSPDYTGAPEKLQSAIIHNMYTGHDAFPFKHELVHRFGVFNKFVPKKMGATASIRSHWGFIATGATRGQLGGWPRSAVTCTNGQAPNKNADPACPDNKLRFERGKGSPGTSNDGKPMSEFELLMMGLINPEDISGDLVVCDTQGSSLPWGGEVIGNHVVADCVSGIKFITPAALEANWWLARADEIRLTPRGKSNPHMRVAVLVVYDSDADLAEAVSAGPKYVSDLRDARQWLDEYLDSVRESWAKDTKQLSSLTFPVRDCHRVGRPDCTASDLTTTAPETTPPPPPGKECTPGQVCCDSNGMFATTAVQCKIQGQRDGYCNAGVCDEPKHCNGPFSSTIMLNGLCGVSSNGCKAKCKSTAGACYNTALWNMGVGLADGAYCELNGARGRCVSQSCQPITATTITTSKAPPAKGNTPTTAPLTTVRPTAPPTTTAPTTAAPTTAAPTTAVPTTTAPTTAPLTTVRPTKGAPTTISRTTASQHDGRNDPDNLVPSTTASQTDGNDEDGDVSKAVDVDGVSQVDLMVTIGGLCAVLQILL